MSSLNPRECLICEKEINKTDDLVTTDCGHTFHYRCAQDRLDKSDRSDCRICRRESAIGNALLRRNIPGTGECSICENSWNQKSDIIITNCCHVFHRNCAQERLNKTGRIDCRTCRRESVIEDALTQSTTNVRND
ncbi:unnamed protein product, partial [Rotaria sp. Silwood1]